MPKFGDWESEENVEYSAYFDAASKAKAGENMNLNFPQDKPDIFPNNPTQVQVSSVKTKLDGKALKEPEIVNSKHESQTRREEANNPLLYSDTAGQGASITLSEQPHGHLRSYGKAQPEATKGPEGLMFLIKRDATMSKLKQHLSQEDGHPRRSLDSSLHHKTVGRKVTSDSPLRPQGGRVASDGPSKAMQHSAVSERSIENSPLHQHYQARIGGKGNGVSSPSWERKGSSEHSSHGLAPSTPGSSRLKPITRGNETVNFSLFLFFF